ncbi:MFS transporter [Agrococcus carbonis]|uniref:MFS transporter, DHA2 family, multidrug resistance protein n=1 Tax=Agrococcus carbonis TaxID=684552 RepID=A0A1H1LV64_9MICO|nr:MFS transporter [Agrococcus carbonis]SDR78514.1 MFS transporter, DHA2 family, multidrug resistance protein [Agrococcus carbonis]
MTHDTRIDAAAPQRAGARAWGALAVLMLPVLLVSIDITALNFALPEIARSLQPTASQQLWIVDAYSLVLATLLVAMGNLGDRVGRRRLLLIGATGFAAASALAAFAPTAELLIAARAAIGLFGATLMPATLALLRTIFLDRRQRRLAVAIWATAFSVGSAAGPIVGGVLLAHFHWGSIFLIAVPVLVPLLVLGPLLVDESRDPAPGPIDPVGILLSMLALGGLAAGVKELASHGLDPLGVALVAVAAVAGWLFVRRMRRVAAPMLDVGLFRVPQFGGALLVNLLSVIALTGFLFFVTQHLQLVEGMEVLDAALVLVPGVLVMIASGLLVVRVVRRVDPGIAVVVGLGASLAAYGMLAALGEDVSVAGIATAFALLGLGIGAAEAISNDLVLTAVPPAKAGAASALSETAYEFGAVLGTTLLGGMLTAVYRATLVVPAGTDAAMADAARETLGGAVAVGEGAGAAGERLVEAARTAFDHGVIATSIAGALLMLLAMVTAWRTLRGTGD